MGTPQALSAHKRTCHTLHVPTNACIHMTPVKGASEKFKLLDGLGQWGGMLAVEQEHVGELLVRNAHDANLSIFGQGTLHTPYMHVGILCARAMAQVNRELKHREAILQQLLAELGCRLALLLRIRRQIEKHQYPHNSIFTKTTHQICTICKFTMYDLFENL